MVRQLEVALKAAIGNPAMQESPAGLLVLLFLTGDMQHVLPDLDLQIIGSEAGDCMVMV